MTYDHWKTTDPSLEWLGPEPQEDGEAGVEQDPEMEGEDEMRQITVDDKVYALAQHFLSDEPEINTPANEAELAMEIQGAIEAWLSDARLEADKRRVKYYGGPEAA